MTLEQAIEQARTRVGGAAALRWGAVGAGLGGVVAVWSPGIGLGLAAVGMGIGWASRPGPKAAAIRLDAGDGATPTAWDHRGDTGPMAAAQRARVEAGLADRVVAIERWPHPAWALVAATWLLPIPLGPPSAPDATTIAAPTDAAPASAAAGSGASAPSSGTPVDAATAIAARTPPDAGPTGDAGSNAGGREPGGRTARGGVGARAGDRRALAVAAERAELSPGTAAGIWLAAAGGTPLPAAPERAGAAPDGRGVDDADVSDPARPFPPRYHGVIAAWFQREGR